MIGQTHRNTGLAGDLAHFERTVALPQNLLRRSQDFGGAEQFAVGASPCPALPGPCSCPCSFIADHDASPMKYLN